MKATKTTIKNEILKNYKSYSKMTKAVELRLGLNEIADYLTTTVDSDGFVIENETLDKVLTKETKKASISASIIQLVNNAFDICIKNNNIVNKYNGLSNNQKRKLILKALMLSTKIDYIFNRSGSTYNAKERYYITKEYNKGYKISLSLFLYQLAVILHDNTITR